MGGIVIEEDLLVKYSIVDSRLPEAKKIHEFLLSRAVALAGRYIDFEKYPVTFLLSDTDEPNAFFAPAFDPKHKPKRDDYKTIRYVINPIETPVICITGGLREMIDNLDQLDFVLAHELTHWMMRMKGIIRNSKGEEGIADLHAVDLMYDAGSDPKQALIMSEKLSAYTKKKKEELEKSERRSRRHEEEEESIDWSSIFDVHLTDSNRKSGIEAALTRLSHLIDDRKPTEIDKRTLTVSYSDPIEEFLAANDYKSSKPLGKLKLLVDCLAHLSQTISPEEYFQQRLIELEAQAKEESRYEIEFRRRDLNKQIEGGYPNYYKGPVIPKKYQQKIAHLAETLIDSVQEERRKEGQLHRPPAINTKDLLVYLQNVAYREVTKHGYPKGSDLNCMDATSLLYSYFYALFSENCLFWNERRDREVQAKSVSLLHQDTETTQQNIRQASTLEDLKNAVERAEVLKKIRIDIRTVGNELGSRNWKLDNLTGFEGGRRDRGRENISILFDKPQVGMPVPWQNLIEIARTSEEAKDYIVKFLSDQGIEDFRITQNLPYIRIGKYSCHSVNEAGVILDDKIESYKIDFALHHDDVLATYDYIRTYFECEDALVERACRKAINISERDFKAGTSLRDDFNAKSKASEKVFALLSMFNALPIEGKARRDFESKRTLKMIQGSYLKANPIPSADEKGRLAFTDDLLCFDNPIFIDYFGDDFEEKQIALKRGRQQKMFDALYNVLEKHVDVWLDAEPKQEVLQKQVRELQSKMWKLDRKTKKKERRVVERQLDAAKREYEHHALKAKESIRIISNFLGSVFERGEEWYNLNRLNDDQKRKLAFFAVKDEKGAVRQIHSTETYERYCDYLRIIETQVLGVVSGNYALTDEMKIVAENYGYEHAATHGSLKAFVDQATNPENKREHRKYAWYLNVFDTMKYLEQSPHIHLNSLMIALRKIKQSTEGSEQKGLNDEAFYGRFRAYKDLITKSNLIKLTSRALHYQGNYDGLTFDELLQTADSMIAFKNQMDSLLAIRDPDDYYKPRQEPRFEPEHRVFLDLLDSRIESLLRSAESEALKNDQALDRMKLLGAIYNYKSEYFSSAPNRNSYLDKWKKDSFIKLSTFSEDPSFWPEDILDHIKSFVYAKNIFLDNRDLENKLISDILDKLEKIPSGRKKSECLYILLDKSIRPAYPETRERIFDIYAQDVLYRIGKDDGTEKFQRRLSVYLKALDEKVIKSWDGEKNRMGRNSSMLSNSISAADKYLLLRRVSDLIVSQEKTSQILKEACHISLGSDDMLASYLYGAGVDYITESMDKDPEIAKRYLRFLNSRGEKADCDSISAFSREIIKRENKERPELSEKLFAKTDPDRHRILYENFWSAPLEARAVIIARVLKGAVSIEEIQLDKSRNSWEHVFDVVMDNIIRPDDHSVEAKYAREIMHSYIKSRSEYERVLILSAMMVANRNIGVDIGNIGKALKLFLENMGPAEIKLGQAIASHPDTPESIRKELQHLKSAANMPARWTVYEWIRTENIPEELWKGKYLGEIMGSASYYTSIALGEEEVLRVLRPEAREKASKGFRVIGSTVEDLRAKDGTTDLSYRELTHSVQEMVTQAGRMSEIETDHDLGQQQYEIAKDLCDDTVLISGNQTFILKVMNWRARGKNWIIMDRARGVTYNSLPEDTPQQIAYKKHFAKSYILFEMTNILSGGRFDHDKHGDQLSVDTATNIAGLYDTGAMALREPLPKEQKSLGFIIYKVLKAGMSGEDIVSAFGRVTSDKIEELHHESQDTQYLVEVKKGILALGDFFKILDKNDVQDIISNINLEADLSIDVQIGITEHMSFFEKAQWQAFLSIQSARESSGLSVKRRVGTTNYSLNVEAYSAQAADQNKAGWLQTIFGNRNEDIPPSTPSSFATSSFNTPHYERRAEII